MIINSNWLSYLILVHLSILLLGCSSQMNRYGLTFENINVQVFHQNNGQLAYTIKQNGAVIIDTSALGIIVGEKVLGTNTSIKEVDTHSINYEFRLYGIKDKATYKGELTQFEMVEADGYKWALEFQVAEEGVAYRYKVPNDGQQIVKGELSSFKFPEKTKVWYFERNNDWKLKSHAGKWMSTDIAQMPDISTMGPVQGLTITCEMPTRGYALIAEAALFNYSGMRLEAVGNNTFKANFTEGQKGFEIDGDITSPWRCILLANDLNALVNNTMVASLNPPPDKALFRDQSWIKPGKTVWHWWSGRHSTYEEEIEMIDDAVSLGFDYSMVDEGWELWNNKWKTTKKLCEYANSKEIGIFLWKRSKEINFPEKDFAIMASFLDSVKQTGAVGIKVDFMNGQTKALINFDEAVLRLAAERQLMVNFHGCQQSSGEYRTYPNEVTREGVLWARAQSAL